MSQCEWILYESGHKFFMKASQILYGFVLLNMGWESQTAVLGHLQKLLSILFLYHLYFKRLEFVICQSWLCWVSGFSLMIG